MIQSVFPDSPIKITCLDDYPVKVCITAKNGAQILKVWEGSQKKLFSKYKRDREATIKEIRTILEELKEDF